MGLLEMMGSLLGFGRLVRGTQNHLVDLHVSQGHIGVTQGQLWNSITPDFG